MEAVQFAYAPTDRVVNLHGEIGVVESCSIDAGNSQKFWVTFPGEKKGGWYFEAELNGA